MMLAGASGGMCSICCDDMTSSSACSIADCGHQFCKSCWRQYLAVQISEGKGAQLRCMGYKCGAACDQAEVKGLLKGGCWCLQCMVAAASQRPCSTWCC